jgi:hypothetical protein
VSGVAESTREPGREQITNKPTDAGDELERERIIVKSEKYRVQTIWVDAVEAELVGKELHRHQRENSQAVDKDKQSIP